MIQKDMQNNVQIWEDYNMKYIRHILWGSCYGGAMKHGYSFFFFDK